MDPLAVFSFYDALSSEDLSILTEVSQLLKAFPNEFGAELLSSLISEGVKYLIGVVMSLVAVVMVVVMVVIMMVVMMLMLVLVVIIVIVVMMFMLMLVIVVIVIMMVVMLMLMLVVIIVMMMFSVLLLKEFDSLLQGVPVLHCLQDLFAFKLIPVGGNDGSVVIMSSHKLHNCLEFILCHVLCVAQDDRRSVLHLIIVELSEVLHIYFCFFSVNYSCESVELKVGIVQSFNSFFDAIYWVRGEDTKIAYIQPDSLFIDDSFAERKRVKEACGIPVFDLDMVESLLNWKS